MYCEMKFIQHTDILFHREIFSNVRISRTGLNNQEFDIYLSNDFSSGDKCMDQQMKSTPRNLLIVSIVLSLFLCPLANRGVSRLSVVEAGVLSFRTLSPMTATFDAPIGTQPPALAPFPTLGPGQYFDEKDVNQPQVYLIEEGDEFFGYGPVSGNDDLYAVWITDESGTHYLIVHKDSELLRGDIDPVTDKRIGNGFDQMMDPWVQISEDIESKLGDINEQQESRMSSHGTALGIAGFGGLICVVVTGGACLVTVGLAALASWGKGVFHNGQRRAEIARLEELQNNLIDEETRIVGKFEIGKANPIKTQQPSEVNK
jgi:hypothetical protein